MVSKTLLIYSFLIMAIFTHLRSQHYIHTLPYFVPFSISDGDFILIPYATSLLFPTRLYHSDRISPLNLSTSLFILVKGTSYISYPITIKGNTQLTQPLKQRLWYVLFEHVSRLDVNLPVYSAHDFHIYLL